MKLIGMRLCILWMATFCSITSLHAEEKDTTRYQMLLTLVEEFYSEQKS